MEIFSAKQSVVVQLTLNFHYTTVGMLPTRVHPSPRVDKQAPGRRKKTSPRHSPPNLLLCQPFHFFFFPCLQSSSVAVLTSPPQRGWWEKPINPARARAGHSPAKSAEPFAENDIKNPCQNLIFWESSCCEFIKSASGNDFDFCRGEDKFS